MTSTKEARRAGAEAWTTESRTDRHTFGLELAGLATSPVDRRSGKVLTPSCSPLPRFLALYGSLFAAFGVASPFLPGLLKQDGLSAGGIGMVLAAGTAIRLLAGPLGGRLADLMRYPSLVLSGFLGASALVATGYAPAHTLLVLLLVSVAQAAVLAPLTPVADALAIGAASSKPGFAYGWVRGVGSAAFVIGTLVSGALVESEVAPFSWTVCRLGSYVSVSAGCRLAS